MRTIVHIMAAAAVLSLFAAPAFAQVNTSQSGTYGQVTLPSGFQPDPYSVTVLAGGEIDASTVDEACVGHIARRADFTLRYEDAGALPLIISATSDGDATLAVRAPDGRWSCDDDSAGALNPMVRFDAPRNGRYQIWVGTFGTEAEPAFLHISEVGVPGQSSGEGPDWRLDPAYGSIDLTSGFGPDPHTQAIAAGGDISASVINDTCIGWIAQAPDYRVNWTAGSGELPLIFSVSSSADTTLVINGPDGQWYCDDDGGVEALNPAITFQSPASGQYDIWVGTYLEGDLQESTLHVSEVSSQ